jgi:adenylate cyclase
MKNIQASLQDTYRKLSRLSYGANFLGGLITFLYLAVFDPVPAGEASVRKLEPADIASFAIAVVVIFASAFILGNWLQRPIRNWQNLFEGGAPASGIPQSVARRILNWPLIASAIVAGTWLFSALFFTFYYADPSNFVGIAIGGVVTTTVIYSGSDLLWRRVIPIFFPQGNLSLFPAIRLWVQRRLLLGFILIGAITPVLLVILTIERSRALIAAANPEVILSNLIIVLLFILLVGLAMCVIVAVLVARAIVNPIQTLRMAMERVENNDYNARVEVTTNDELGFLSERFNHMTGGLRQGEKLRQLFGLYVSPEVARAAVETGAGLGGELVNCTVMFSDIRDFTSLTEQMPPDRLVDLINNYMSEMVSVIVNHGGMVTRFGGDSILAVYGTPLNPMDNHADQAVNAGIEMRRRLADFNQAGSTAEQPILDNGIGIASGFVIAGNVGGKERIEYTVMGDAANLAARLEDMTKDLNFPILLSSETHQALSELAGAAPVALKDVQIKGKQEKVTIYALPA